MKRNNGQNTLQDENSYVINQKNILTLKVILSLYMYKKQRICLAHQLSSYMIYVCIKSKAVEELDKGTEPASIIPKRILSQVMISKISLICFLIGIPAPKAPICT